jgi:acetolactate synthase-1/2/3 large subunit
MSFLTAAGIPVITSTAAWSSVPGNEALSLGHAGLWRNDAGARLLARADALVLIEADEETGELAREIAAVNRDIPVVQPAALAAAVGSLVPVTVGITGSVVPVLDDLAAAIRSLGETTSGDRRWPGSLAQARKSAETRFLRNIGPARGQKSLARVIDAIGSAVGPDTVIVCDGKTVCGWAMVRLRREGLHATVMLDGVYSAGAGFPLALGMKCARKNQKVILLSDAGSFKRHSREIETMMRYDLPLTVFLFQEKDKKPREEVDFAAFAGSFGLEARVITDPERQIDARTIRDAVESSCGVLFDMTR